MLPSIKLRIISFLIFLNSIGHITPIEIENGLDGLESQGIPFNALMIWHSDDRDDDSFFQQRRLIIALINGFPVQTHVSVITFGTKTNVEVTFIKDSTEFNSSWTAPLMQYAEERSEIPYVLSIKINDALFKYFDIKAKMAEEVFLIVNHNSVIDYEDKAREALELKKTSIVFYGKNSDETVNIWMNLATDTRHFHMLDNNDGNINELVESILNTTYDDSRLFCNNDQYWTGKRCYSCTYICSKTVKRPSEFCLKNCPYFNHVMSDTKIGAELEDKGVNSQRNDNQSFTFLNTVLILIAVLSLCTFVAVMKLAGLARELRKNWNKLKRFCKTLRGKFSTLQIVTDDTNDGELRFNGNDRALAFEERTPLLAEDDIDDVRANSSPGLYSDMSDMELKAFS